MAYRSGYDADLKRDLDVYFGKSSDLPPPNSYSDSSVESWSGSEVYSFERSNGYGSDAYSSNDQESAPLGYSLGSSSQGDQASTPLSYTSSPSPSPLRDSPSIAPFSGPQGSLSSQSSNPNELLRSFDALRRSNPNVVSSSPSSSPSPMRAKQERNWSADFYSIQSNLSKTSGQSNSSQLDSNESLIAITSQFTEQAVAVGTKIIEEQFIADKSKRAFQPVNVGGIAGGEKFIHEGIFYKFALDEHQLYGNSIENAMKTAGHELKGLTALLDWELKSVGLHTIKFPLMVLIDHRGFRLIAMSILPLKKDTLYYGSDDGAKTMKSPDPLRPSTKRLHELIATWATYLNLSPHDIITISGESVNIRTPFDLEGHVGIDGNLYCCDFARMFPPAGKEPKFQGGFLYRLLRPEFVKKYPIPLCSDGYISTVVEGRNHNLNLENATNNLLTDIIPKFGQWISANPLGGNIPTRLLLILVHQNGINFRSLRVLAHYITNADLQRRLLTEIVARTLKNILRACFRAMSTSDPEAYKKQVAFFFTLVFGTDAKSVEFWVNRLPKEVNRRYTPPAAPSPAQQSVANSGRPRRRVVEAPVITAEPPRMTFERADVDILILFERVCELMNIQLSEEGQRKILTLAKNMDALPLLPPELRIIPEDVLTILPRVKRMFLTSYQEAINLKRRADLVDDFEEREALLRYSANCYLECLEAHTQNEFALHNLSRICEELAVFYSNSPSIEKMYEFIHKRCKTLAIEKNAHLKTYLSDIYQYSDLYQARSGAITKALAEPKWVEYRVIKRLLLAAEEISSMGEASREDICGYYEEIFGELAEPEQSSELKLSKRIALCFWKLIVTTFPTKIDPAACIYFADLKSFQFCKSEWMELLRFLKE